MVNSLFRLSPQAIADLEDIWRYTAQEWSPDQADTYVHALMNAAANLAKGKSVGVRTHVRAGYWKYAVGAHMLYFTKSADNINIIRILHKRMDVVSHL